MAKMRREFFDKIALSEDAKYIISKEKETLEQISTLGMYHFIYPEIINDNESVLSLTDLHKGDQRRETSLLLQHGHAIREIYKYTSTDQIIGSLYVVKRSANLLKSLAASEDPRMPKNLLKKLTHLRNSISLDKSIPCCFFTWRFYAF